MKYRSDIDGLRAVAIVVVILFHSAIPGFSGGFIGVDVFFVISGFLITSRIIELQENNSFKLLTFYSKRIRRLLPSYMIVLISVLLMATITFPNNTYDDFVKSVLSTLGLYSNWYFLSEVGYFDASAEAKPLLHMWSLSIEEQFYIFFPLLMLSIQLSVQKYRLPILSLIAIISLIFSIFLIKQDNTDAAFFNTFSRAWELLIGSCIASYRHIHPMKENNFGNRFLQLLGIVLIILPAIVYSNETPFPGQGAIAPTLGTALLILFNTKSILSSLLSSSIAVYIGKLSYSLYLWHWPVFVFAHWLLPEKNYLITFNLIQLTFLLAFLTYTFIEKPIITRSLLSTNKALYTFSVFIIGIATLLTLLSYNTYIRDKRLFFTNNKAQTLALKSISTEITQYMLTSNLNYTKDLGEFNLNKFQGYTCSLDRKTSIDNILKCLLLQSKDKNVLIVGDSIGRDTYHALKYAFPTINFLMLHQSGCVPADHGRCFQNLENILDKIESSINVNNVILAFRYRQNQWLPIEKDLKKYTNRFQSVLMFGVTPILKVRLSEYILTLKDGESIPTHYINGNNHIGIRNIKEVASHANNMAMDNNIGFVDTTQFFCTDEKCRLWLGTEDYKKPIFWDVQHMTPSAIREFGNFLAQNEQLNKVLSN